MMDQEVLIKNLVNSGGLTTEIYESLRECPYSFFLHQCIIRISETDQFKWILRPKRHGEIQLGVGEIKRLIINEKMPAQSSCIEFIEKLGEAAEEAHSPSAKNQSKTVVADPPSPKRADNRILQANEELDLNTLFGKNRILKKTSSSRFHNNLEELRLRPSVLDIDEPFRQEPGGYDVLDAKTGRRIKREPGDLHWQEDREWQSDWKRDRELSQIKKQEQTFQLEMDRSEQKKEEEEAFAAFSLVLFVVSVLIYFYHSHPDIFPAVLLFFFAAVVISESRE